MKVEDSFTIVFRWFVCFYRNCTVQYLVGLLYKSDERQKRSQRGKKPQATSNKLTRTFSTRVQECFIKKLRYRIMPKLTIISLFILSITSTFLLLIHHHEQNPLLQELTTYTSNSDHRKCPFHNLFHCPTSSSYPQSCLSNIIPPWPICLTKNVNEWYNISKDSSMRCCKENGGLV
jgi:hypothetical protein